MGRTGTLIAIDIALEQAAEEGMVDIAGIVYRMRDQRMKMVQTAVRLRLPELILWIMNDYLMFVYRSSMFSFMMLFWSLLCVEIHRSLHLS